MSYGDNITWGRGKGCDFLNERCITEDLRALDTEFCVDTDYVSSCTHHHLAKGVCSITRYVSPVPDAYQYFKDDHIGGADGDLDYCPHILQFWNGDCRNTDYNMRDNMYFEEFGHGSRCIQGTFVPDGHVPHLHAGCYDVTCLNDRAQIRIGEHTVECFFNGMSSTATIPGFEGKVICPDSNALCSTAIPCINGCTGRGVCVAGTCNCDEGYFTADCSCKCDKICLTCSGASSFCTSCHPEMVHSSSAGTCSCDLHASNTTDDDDWFMEPF
jgi:hypothetical protein